MHGLLFCVCIEAFQFSIVSLNDKKTQLNELPRDIFKQRVMKYSMKISNFKYKNNWDA